MHISHTSTESITIMIIRDRQIDRHRDRESQSTKKQKWFTSWRRSRKLLGAFLIEATRSRALACLVLRLDPFACFFGWGPVYHKHQSIQNMCTWELANDQVCQILMQSCWKAKLNHMVDAFVMHFVSVVVPWRVWEGTHFAHPHLERPHHHHQDQ